MNNGVEKAIKVSEIKRKYIDWKKTSILLRMLRLDNRNLRRYVCYTLKSEENNCSAEDCETLRWRTLCFTRRYVEYRSIRSSLWQNKRVSRIIYNLPVKLAATPANLKKTIKSKRIYRLFFSAAHEYNFYVINRCSRC